MLRLRVTLISHFLRLRNLLHRNGNIFVGHSTESKLQTTSCFNYSICYCWLCIMSSKNWELLFLSCSFCCRRSSFSCANRAHVSRSPCVLSIICCICCICYFICWTHSIRLLLSLFSASICAFFSVIARSYSLCWIVFWESTKDFLSDSSCEI